MQEVVVVELTRNVPVEPEHVFAVLADGWSFAGWVVGASHIRAVDEGWPEVGTRIHHSVGPWPAAIQDVTTVTSVRPNATLALHARLWPVGAARVELSLRPAPGGGTHIVMAEEIVDGPGKLMPGPLQAALLKPRNDESLKRLEAIAVGRAR